MRENKKHPIKKWEVSIIEIQEAERIKFKVTRRLPEMSIAETKIINNKKETKKLFYEWLK